MKLVLSCYSSFLQTVNSHINIGSEFCGGIKIAQSILYSGCFTAIPRHTHKLSPKTAKSESEISIGRLLVRRGRAGPSLVIAIVVLKQPADRLHLFGLALLLLLPAPAKGGMM